MHVISEHLAFGGRQLTVEHSAQTLDCDMRFGLYLPENYDNSRGALLWLSGLTCTHENFATKAGAQAHAAVCGMALIMPDTSPRGDSVPDDAHGAYDFGLGAGFYVDATEEPWRHHYQMRSYVLEELLPAVCDGFAIDPLRIGVSGHSMGGHGALILALTAPERFVSVSAFAPICAPGECPWGQKAFTGYLGTDTADWRRYDACALIEDGARVSEILVDQGLDDEFLGEQLKPERLEAVCAETGIELTLRRQPGYDHSYYFIASFVAEHIAWHSERLSR